MTRFHRITGAALVLLALAAIGLAGCGKGSSLTSSTAASGGSTGTTSSVAGTAYDAAAITLGAGDSLAPLPLGPLGFPGRIPSGCAWDAATQSFVCAQEPRRDGLVETRGYQFLDASGAAQGAYDSVTTASIKLDSHLSGTTTHGRWSTVDDVRALVMSGLAGDETTRIWNGTAASSRQDSVLDANGTKVLRTTAATTTVENVVVPKPWQRDSWPTSGTITTHVVSNDGTSTIDLTGVLTFNGTALATLVVGGITYTIDLARPPHRPGPGGGPGGAPSDSLPPPPPGGGRR